MPLVVYFMISRSTLSCIHWLEFVYTECRDIILDVILQGHETFGLLSRRQFYHLHLSIFLHEG